MSTETSFAVLAFEAVHALFFILTVYFSAIGGKH